MSYHHGDLKRALLDALAATIATQGLERFSLREVARRAGVTHGAPAHHFGDKRGLLTAFATEGAVHLATSVHTALDAVAPADHPMRLTAVGLGYLEFALAYPVHFQVTFRPELLNIHDADLASARAEAGATLDLVLRAAAADGWLHPDDYPNVRLASWSLAHGFATLAAEALRDLPDAALRRQAKSAFDHYTRRMLVAGATSAQPQQ